MCSERYEEITRAAWREVLGTDLDVQDDTDFFLSGGNSMEAAAATASISRQIGRRVRLRQLLETPTFGSYVSALERLISDG